MPTTEGIEEEKSRTRKKIQVVQMEIERHEKERDKDMAFLRVTDDVKELKDLQLSFDFHAREAKRLQKELGDLQKALNKWI